MTGNHARFAVATSGTTRLPCNDHAVQMLLDAANAALLLDEAGAGVIRAEVTAQGATLHLQQKPPDELGLYCVEGRRRAGPLDASTEHFGRTQFKGVTLEWQVAS